MERRLYSSATATKVGTYRTACIGEWSLLLTQCKGRAQALNLRDTTKAQGTTVKIVIANRKDDYASTADKDGFGSTDDWAAVAKEADVLFLLVPDEVCLRNWRTDPVMFRTKAF
jgi:ketol-acid reductoisomerase